jgi:hypothetical protein
VTLAERGDTSIQSVIDVERLESHMLQLPQAECPVVHHFGPGVYIREVTLPAGTFAVGHEQRHEHLNIMLTGKVAIISDDGSTKILQAPMIFVGKPGRKVGLILETCIWQNVYPNTDEERDVDALEARWLDKSGTWQAYQAAEQLKLMDLHQGDREDFAEVARLAGFDLETIRRQSENEDDQIPMPDGHGLKVTIRPSPIEGLGVFLSFPAEKDEVIAPARIRGYRTPAGRYTNHSPNPNAIFVKSESGDIYLVAQRRISGCCGGSQGEEVTVDYRQALALSGIYLSKGE